MGKRSLAIIGAGLSGLSAGCYGRMNGYDTIVLESHHLPGGLCTAWTRQGYTFDGCIHWLTSSAPGDSLYGVWEELGAVQGRRIYDHDIFWRIAGADGRAFSLHASPDRLEEHMKELSPADAGAIEELGAWIRRFVHFNMQVGKPRELMSLPDLVKLAFRMRGHLRAMRELSETRLGAFAGRFRDPLLAEGLRQSVGSTAPVIALVMTLAQMARHAAGFPAGGSLEFARAIERRYRSLGGEIRYGARVARILERNGKAVGVELENGEHVEADVVISAADLRMTLRSLLDGTRQDETHRVLMESGEVYPSCIQLSFGVRCTIHELDECLGEAFELKQPLQVGEARIDWLTVKSYGFDPSLAPDGYSVITSVLPGDWDYWNRLRGDPGAYAAEKERLADACAAAIDARYPGFRDAIEIRDVATPVTFERYTSNWKGTFMTWQLTPEFRRKFTYVRKTVPGLDDFYIASMWTLPPGGLPSAAMAGREVIQILCAKDRKRFVTAKPSP